MAINSICIRTEPADEKLAIGASKIGGLPDLPPNFDWARWLPDTTDNQRYEKEWERTKKLWSEHGLELRDRPTGLPLSFIAQVNLADTRPHDLEMLLPPSGILYFFYDAIEQPGGMCPEDPGGWRVMYYDGDMSRLTPTPAPDDLSEESRFNALALRFQHELTLPYWGSVFLRWLGMSQEEEFRYSDILDELIELGLVNQACPDSDWRIDLHRILGHPDHEQGDVFIRSEMKFTHLHWEDPELVKSATNWRLLFQVDSVSRSGGEKGMMWGDVGHIYYCIRPDDLQSRDFSKVWLVHQCG